MNWKRGPQPAWIAEPCTGSRQNGNAQGSSGLPGQTPETPCQFLFRNRAPGICAHRFQSCDHLGRGQYGRPLHLVNDPQEVVVLNALFEGEGSHAPVFRNQRVPPVMGQGKAVHQAGARRRL